MRWGGSHDFFRCRVKSTDMVTILTYITATLPRWRYRVAPQREGGLFVTCEPQHTVRTVLRVRVPSLLHGVPPLGRGEAGRGFPSCGCVTGRSRSRHPTAASPTLGPTGGAAAAT